MGFGLGGPTEDHGRGLGLQLGMGGDGFGARQRDFVRDGGRGRFGWAYGLHWEVKWDFRVFEWKGLGRNGLGSDYGFGFLGGDNDVGSVNLGLTVGFKCHSTGTGIQWRWVLVSGIGG